MPRLPARPVSWVYSPDVMATRDLAGHVFGDELRRIGWQGDADPADLRGIGAYFELHIEQGKRLEDAGLTIGVVDRALAQIWCEITVLGEEAHAGSPMAGRRDAMMAAAALIERNAAPTDADIDAAMTNFCRCGIYPRLRPAIRLAARVRSGAEAIAGAPPPGSASPPSTGSSAHSIRRCW